MNDEIDKARKNAQDANNKFRDLSNNNDSKVKDAEKVLNDNKTLADN